MRTLVLAMLLAGCSDPPGLDQRDIAVSVEPSDLMLLRHRPHPDLASSCAPAGASCETTADCCQVSGWPANGHGDGSMCVAGSTSAVPSICCFLAQSFDGCTWATLYRECINCGGGWACGECESN